MSGKRITKDHFEYMKAQGPNFATYHDWNLLMDHIEDVGEFAPAGSGSKDVDAVLAKAQGWTEQNDTAFYDQHGTPDRPVRHWVSKNPFMKIAQEDYHPSTDLDQAVEAASKIEEMHGIGIGGITVTGAGLIVDLGFDVPTVTVRSAKSAALLISHRLYYQLTKRDI